MSYFNDRRREEMIETFKNILVPYNGTEDSHKAFESAIALASPLQAKINIFTCIEKRQIFSLFQSKTKDNEFEKEKKIVEKQHSGMKTFAKENGVACSSKIVHEDHAADAILSFSDRQNIDLIIMSKTKFSSHKERMHYQSTLESVFRNATCPILTLI